MRLSLSRLLSHTLPKAPAAARVAFLKAQPFAHRGLHGGGTIENSREAFAAAMAVGHGIELDVQLSADGVPFVFHDDRLDRLTDAKGVFTEQDSAALCGLRLRGVQETIPLLEEVLELVAGRVPLLIEIKTVAMNINPICLAVRRALEGYRGDVAIMSFSPRVPRWFQVHAERIVRGLVMTEAEPAKSRIARLKAALAVRLSLHRSRPDFIAYDITKLPSTLPTALRAHGLPMLTWTVRSADQERVAHLHADEMIYEKPAS